MKIAFLEAVDWVEPNLPVWIVYMIDKTLVYTMYESFCTHHHSYFGKIWNYERHQNRLTLQLTVRYFSYLSCRYSITFVGISTWSTWATSKLNSGEFFEYFRWIPRSCLSTDFRGSGAYCAHNPCLIIAPETMLVVSIAPIFCQCASEVWSFYFDKRRK